MMRLSSVVRIASLGILSVPLFVSGCSSQRCTFEARPGVTLVVTDSTTGERVCDAIIETRDIQGRLVSQTRSHACGPASADDAVLHEQSGRFLLPITSPRHIPATREVVLEKEEVCDHVLTQHIAVELEPSSDASSITDAGSASDAGE